MEQNSAINPVQPVKRSTNIFTSLTLMWIILTGLYLGGLFASKALELPATIIGLFVPFGFLNAFFVLGILKGVPFFVFLAILVVVEFVYSRVNIKPLQKIAINLLILFLFTMFLDFAMFHKWCSYYMIPGVEGHNSECSIQ